MFDGEGRSSPYREMRLGMSSLAITPSWSTRVDGKSSMISLSVADVREEKHSVISEIRKSRAGIVSWRRKYSVGEVEGTFPLCCCLPVVLGQLSSTFTLLAI